MKRPETNAFSPAVLCVLALLLLLFPGSVRSEAPPHTIVLACDSGGFVGRSGSRNRELTLSPDTCISAADGTSWQLEELAALPGFRLRGAALRFTADEVTGLQLAYGLVCGKTFSPLQCVLPGCNLWDAKAPVAAWLNNPEESLRILAVHREDEHGIRIREGSVSLQLSFSVSSGLPDFPLDKVQDRPVYDAGLALLEEGNPFITRYDDIADSILTPMLPLGVPYYYAGRSEDKFLNRYYPQTTTNYYRGDRMYLCGLDCAGMTRLIYEKSGLPRHPTILSLLNRQIGTVALRNNDPSLWPALLQPGDLIAVQHGYYHIMMYLGTLRQFGWTEEDAGDALPVLDAPLVLHCSGDPFYYDRYLAYIRENGFRGTDPPDGGVTVSVIQPSRDGAPHSMVSSWGKTFAWYLADDHPLLVFPLDDCTKLAWYSPD